MKLNGWASAAVAAALAVLLGWQQCALVDARRAGAADARTRDSLNLITREIRAMRDSSNSRQIRYVRDTIRLTAVRRRTDTVLVTYRDTLIHRDTVRVLVERERAACDLALRTCELRVAAADSAASLERVRADLYRRQAEQRQCRILRVAPCPSRTASALVGVAVGAVAVGAIRR